MSVKIRLTRKGSKKRPYYRFVAADSTSRRDGKFLEVLGGYDPSRMEETLQIHQDRVKYWVSQGAELTDTARRVLRSKGVLG